MMNGLVFYPVQFSLLQKQLSFLNTLIVFKLLALVGIAGFVAFKYQWLEDTVEAGLCHKSYFIKGYQRRV